MTTSWTLQVYRDAFHRFPDNLEIPFRWDTHDVDFQHQFSMGKRQKLLWRAGYRLVNSSLGKSARDNGFLFHTVEERHADPTHVIPFWPSYPPFGRCPPNRIKPSGVPGIADEIPSYFSLDARLAWRARKNLRSLWLRRISWMIITPSLAPALWFARLSSKSGAAFTER